MSLLTVDVGGANQTAIPFAKAGHAEPRQVGKRRYAFAGNERSMIRSEPMVIPLVGDNMPASTVATLRSLFALGARVLCEGDVFNNGNVSVYCSGELSDEMEVGGAYWIPTLTLTVVTAATSGVFALSAAPGGTTTVRALINGPRYGTARASGVATTSVARPSVVRRISAGAAGVATTSARTTIQQLNIAASGAATTSARTVAQQITMATSAGGATVTITGTKIP